MWTLRSKIHCIGTVFENIMKCGLKEGISIDADFGPIGYVLWWCGSKSWEVCTFFQICSDHAVEKAIKFCKISNLGLSYVVAIKFTLDISKKFWAVSDIWTLLYKIFFQNEKRIPSFSLKLLKVCLRLVDPTFSMKQPMVWSLST